MITHDIERVGGDQKLPKKFITLYFHRPISKQIINLQINIQKYIIKFAIKCLINIFKKTWVIYNIRNKIIYKRFSKFNRSWENFMV